MVRFFILVFIALALFVTYPNWFWLEKNRDRAIRLHNETNFERLRGYTFAVRSTDPDNGNLIVFAWKHQLPCGPLVFHFNPDTKKIEKTLTHLLRCKTEPSSPLQQEITGLVPGFMDMQLQLVRVDSMGNVYINPAQHAEPEMLRAAKANHIGIDTSVFKHYNGLWFVRKTSLD